MTDPYVRAAQGRLDAALHRLAAALRGATVHPDEHNCECHWGGPADLALLRTPDAPLDADLLRRTWRQGKWNDPGAVLRRVLPQLAAELADRGSDSSGDREDIGWALARADWPRWPAEQAAAVGGFLHALWIRDLLVPGDAREVDRTLGMCVQASGELAPWLDAWAALDHPSADRGLAAAVDVWTYDLLSDALPWSLIRHSDREDALAAELSAWLTCHAPARLRAHGAPDDLLHRVRLLGLSEPERWRDPHWPGRAY
ncbi:hypothetical protein [Kitasatospora sp. NPDC057198]|uniref:hypothetical protein n=1 Tax=Kitasatospora sp. NPDC057198 TaxID=3346046 RepID=UPI00363D2C9E